MQDNSEIKKEMQKLKTKLSAEKDKIEDIATLIQKKIEREVGLWEYDFEELEKEMWKRFTTLEENSDCASEEELFQSKKILGTLFRRLRKWYRTLSSPFSRSIIDKKKQFNLDKQNRVNQENIPLHLAVILSLQKIKDRLNTLEDNIQKLQEDQEDSFKELHTPVPDVQKNERGHKDGED